VKETLRWMACVSRHFIFDMEEIRPWNWMIKALRILFWAFVAMGLLVIAWAVFGLLTKAVIG